MNTEVLKEQVGPDLEKARLATLTFVQEGNLDSLQEAYNLVSSSRQFIGTKLREEKERIRKESKG